ncbi:MAG: stage II sporulation protein M [Myxococcales bacterium]
MAESLPHFVQRRRASWEELGGLLDGLERSRLSVADLARLDRLYRRAASDLAHANTFFTGSDAAVYLNQLCARAYGHLYRKRGGNGSALKQFFLREFPRTLLEERRYLWAALLILLSGALVGTVAAVAEPRSLEMLIGQAVRDHLAQGTLWTDEALSAVSPLVLGSRIVTNNIAVALTAFALGLTAGLGTAALLFINGLHLGALVTMCFQAKLGPSLLAFTAAHGFVELSAVLVAGQAGLIVGAALVAPGELSRADALRLRGRRALTLLFGTVPLFAVVGMVEGFVSPGRLFAPEMKLALGLALLALLVTYVVRFGRGELAGK